MNIWSRLIFYTFYAEYFTEAKVDTQKSFLCVSFALYVGAYYPILYVNDFFLYAWIRLITKRIGLRPICRILALPNPFSLEINYV